MGYVNSDFREPTSKESYSVSASLIERSSGIKSHLLRILPANKSIMSDPLYYTLTAENINPMEGK